MTDQEKDDLAFIYTEMAVVYSALVLLLVKHDLWEITKVDMLESADNFARVGRAIAPSIGLVIPDVTAEPPPKDAN